MHTSYHCHTSMTHGLSTVSDYVQAAIAAGLDELGIAEHYTLVPGQSVTWSLPPSGLPDYFRALHAVRREARIDSIPQAECLAVVPERPY